MENEQVAPEQEPVETGFGEDGRMDVEAAADDLAAALGAVDEGEPDAEPAQEGAAPVETPPVPETAPAEPVQPAQPEWTPDTWRAEAKAKWTALDPTIKAEVQKRETDVARFVNEAQPAIQTHRQLVDTLRPYAGIFKQYNVDPLQHIGNLLQAHTQLVFGTPETKLAMFKTMAQDAGINLAALADPNAQTQAVDPNLPYIRRLEHEVSQLKEGVTGVTSTLRQAREAELSQGITDFAADKENHPYFWELSADMTKLINQGSASNLQDAYDIARVQNPVYRAKMAEAEVAKQLEASRAKERERVAAARKASGANVKSRSGGRTPPPAETIDETLRSTLSDIRTRSH